MRALRDAIRRRASIPVRSASAHVAIRGYRQRNGSIAKSSSFFRQLASRPEHKLTIFGQLRPGEFKGGSATTYGGCLAAPIGTIGVLCLVVYRVDLLRRSVWSASRAQRVPENPSVNHVLLTRMGLSADHVRHTPRLVRTLSTRVPKLDLFVNLIEPTIFQKSAQGVNNGVMHRRLSPLPCAFITSSTLHKTQA